MTARCPATVGRPTGRMRRHGGQAALELLVCVPLILLAGVVAWQIAAAMWAGIRAEEAVRRDALQAPGAGVLDVEATAAVPGLLVSGGRVTVHARVVAP